jgi:glycosyltransferase involved in cell wall biosynthesis
VGPEELPLWYSACDFFVIPSLYEGFGLTLLEALACGAPAIAANRASLPEVAGDAAVLVDPDAGSLATALVALAENQDLKDQLSAKGPLQAAHFTWQRTAELTVASYRKALS